MESQMEDRRELILVFDPINPLWSYLKGKLPIRESSAHKHFVVIPEGKVAHQGEFGGEWSMCFF